MDIKEIEILGDTIGEHWYYRSKSAALLRIIRHVSPRLLLDVGAGSGFFSRYLLQNTDLSTAICVDPGYEREWDDVAGGKSIQFRRTVDSIDVDLVLMMDVLEHVNDDVGLLEHYASRVSRGTWFLITVPAFKFLWSAHDEFLEHRRRYTLPALEAAVGRAGLVVNRGAYFFAAVLPIAAALRLSERVVPRQSRTVGSQLKRHGKIVNAVLATCCEVELPVMRWNRLAGLTVYCLARLP
jgi:hypothetical protein